MKLNKKLSVLGIGLGLIPNIAKADLYQCLACPGGTYGNGASTSCTKCKAGTYAPAGSSSCTTCKAGTYSGAGASSCTTCKAGTYSGAGASSCTPCANGQYAPAGSSSCKTCPYKKISYTYMSSCKGENIFAEYTCNSHYLEENCKKYDYCKPVYKTITLKILTIPNSSKSDCVDIDLSNGTLVSQWSFSSNKSGSLSPGIYSLSMFATSGAGYTCQGSKGSGGLGGALFYIFSINTTTSYNYTYTRNTKIYRCGGGWYGSTFSKYPDTGTFKIGSKTFMVEQGADACCGCACNGVSECNSMSCQAQNIIKYGGGSSVSGLSDTDGKYFNKFRIGSGTIAIHKLYSY